MTIYDPVCAEGYGLCRPVHDGDHATIARLINGSPRAIGWTPIAMRLLHAESRTGRTFKRSDCPWYRGDALIFRKSVVAALGSLLREHGELLPLACTEAELVIYNVTRVLPAIDESASGVKYDEDGEITTVRHVVFRPDVIAGKDIFKVAKLRVSPTLVTQRFVDLWRAAGLQGVTFYEARYL